MSHDYTALIERDDNWFIAYCLEVSGANGQGKTKEKALASLAEAISLLLEDRGESGGPVTVHEQCSKTEFPPLDRTITIVGLHEQDDDLEYWLSRTVNERLAAAELIRRTIYGSRATAPLQRVFEDAPLRRG